MALRVASVQYRSGNIPEKNIEQVYHLAKHISYESPDIILLPEHTFFLDKIENFKKHAHPSHSHPWTLLVENWAREFNSIVVAGSIPELNSEDPDEKTYQTSVIAFPQKELETQFLRKRMLFRGIPRNRELNEAKYIARGNKGYHTFDVKGWCVGLTLCVELRYASIFHTLRYQYGCDVVLTPSSFYHFSGRNHWLTLLKARAIEYQYYIASANQCALPNEKNPVFIGQSTIIDPWGTPLSLAPIMSEALCLQDLHKEQILKSRIKVDTAYNIQE